MFKCIGGDFPAKTIYSNGELILGINQKYSLRGNIDEIIIFPEKKKRVVSFECHLKDGKKFIADADATTFQKIQVDKISAQVQPGEKNYIKNNKNIKRCLIVFIVIIALSIVGGLTANKDESTSTFSSMITLDKAQAGELDKQVWGQVVEVININNEIMDGMTRYAQGTISAVDLYDYCKNASTTLGELSITYPNVKDENAKQYIDSCSTFTLYVQSVAQSLMKYIDKGGTENLSKVKENIGRVTDGSSIVTNNRVVFLQLAGYSDEEIKALAENVDEQIN